MQVHLRLEDPGGGLIAEASSSGPRAGVAIDPQQILFTGAPARVEVTSLAGTGGYELQFLQDAAIEHEMVSGAPNDTPGTAQDISNSNLGPGAQLPGPGDRLAVYGAAGPEGDYFRVPRSNFMSLVLRTLGNGDVRFEVRDASDNLLALSGDGADDADAIMQQLRTSGPGDLLVRVVGDAGVPYLLAASRIVQLGLEPDEVSGSIQEFSGFAFGLLGSLAGGASAAGGTIRVGVLTDKEPQVIDQLNDSTVFDFEAEEFFSEDLADPSALDAFDVIILGSDVGFDIDLEAVEPLVTWVESGRGLVSVGGTLGSLQFLLDEKDKFFLEAADLWDSIIPVSFANVFGLGANHTIQVQDNSHPVTAGLASLPFDGFYEAADDGADPDARVLSTSIFGHPIVAVSEPGFGRSAFLALPYHQVDPLTDLTVGPYDQLLEQAVAWAALGGGGQGSSDTYRRLALANDAVTVRVRTVRGDLAPRISLLASDGTTLAAAGGDGGRDVQLTHTFTDPFNDFLIQVAAGSGSGE